MLEIFWNQISNWELTIYKLTNTISIVSQPATHIILSRKSILYNSILFLFHIRFYHKTNSNIRKFNMILSQSITYSFNNFVFLDKKYFMIINYKIFKFY